MNPMKMARCIRELERIYGIRNGGGNFTGNQFVKKEELSNNFKAPNKTQDNLAEQLGVTSQQLHNYKKLNKLIPELQDLVENDKLSLERNNFAPNKEAKPNNSDLKIKVR